MAIRVSEYAWPKMSAREFDAIVVGASFAGLAVARQVRGRVLLLDRNEVGAFQTSACGTPLWLAEVLGVTSSVLQVHDRLTIRTGRHAMTYDLSAVPFCTFDYRAFCRGLLDQCQACFLRAAVTEFREGRVATSEGSFSAPIVVDCSGWRGVLVNGPSGVKPGRDAYTFGLEAHTPVRDDGLTFFIDREVIPGGLGWVFPVGAGSLVGLGSYTGQSKLRPSLDRYLEDQRIASGAYHGTYFPNRPRRATVGRLFAVGDAAGQCLPLTAEGIRPAIYFGGECGKIVQRIITGAMTLEAGLARYRALVRRYRTAYWLLWGGQWLTLHAPMAWLTALTRLAAHPPLHPRWWPRYGRFGRSGPVPMPA
jgi:flavin-dependent dehydrogenase